MAGQRQPDIEDQILARHAIASSTDGGNPYLAVSTDQGRAIAADVIRSWSTERAKTLTTVLTRLACFVPGSLEGQYDCLAERHIYYPGILYLGASASARDALIQRLEPSLARRLLTCSLDDNVLEQDHLLICLAWIGDARVRELFSLWRRQPPKWQRNLHIPAWQYARCAGWELVSDGTRRELYAPEAYTLQPPPAATAADDRALGALLAGDAHCGWCGMPLVTLFDLNLADPRFSWLNMRGQRLRIAMCQRCTCFCTVYTKVDGDGGIAWHPGNVRPAFNGHDADTYTPLPKRPLVLGARRRSVHETYLQAWSGGPYSQIGGSGIWWQDEDFPECPQCKRLMPMVGQLAWEEVERYSEGTTYAFLCADCGVAATSYQQT